MSATTLNAPTPIGSNTLKVGTDTNGKQLFWDFMDVPNFNICVLGASGSGKTHSLRHIVHYLAKTGITVHVMDIKDDFSSKKFISDGLNDVSINDLDFSYVGGDCGLNILQFPKTPEAGGVYMAIQSFLEIIHIFNPSFSKKMDSYLTVILTNAYEKKGIYHDDMQSWLNSPPSLEDVLIEIDSIFHHISIGGDRKTINQIFSLKESLKKARKNKDASEESINELKDNLIAGFSSYVNDGLEDDHAEYMDWNINTLHAVKDTIQTMVNSFIFTRKTKPRLEGMINRYSLAGVSDLHKRILMQVIMTQVFNMSVAHTRNTGHFDPQRPKHFVVFDEGKHAKALAKTDMSMFNRIATEGRGYGLGLGLGVQIVNHITHDMARNFGTQFLLSTPEASHKEVTKTFGAPKHLIKQLIPRRNFLFKASGLNYALLDSFV